ncbi:MAG: imelysin family protein [Pseudomonadota bacterium]
MRLIQTLILTCLPLGVQAGTVDVLDRHILPGYARFAEATSALATATDRCDVSVMRPAYNEAFDAWLGISHIQLGPIEDRGLTLAIAFWPDPKDRAGKTLRGLVVDQDPIAEDADAYETMSVAARGFMAMERMLYDPPEGEADYICALTTTIAADLATSAQVLTEDWVQFADLMRAPGDGNTRFLSEQEVERALFTSLSTGLAFLQDQRLGRPLGTFDRPRPLRAEARRSGRSLRNIDLSLVALRDLADTLSGGEAADALAQFDAAIERAASIDDPDLSGVANPGGRIRIEALSQSVSNLRQAVAFDIGERLGVKAGFNSLDGD